MTTRRPAAFDLNTVRFEPQDLYPPQEDHTEAQPPPAPRRRRWIALFVAASGALLTLAIGLAVDNLIRSLFTRYDWLGWVGLGLAALALVAVLAIATAELVSIARLRRIDNIRGRAETAAATDDRAVAVSVLADLHALYRNRAETARGRTALGQLQTEIIDGRDLIGMAETALLAPLDSDARRLVVAASRRVAVVTAVSPRAVVDLLFVAIEILRLIGRLATLYGGRPGAFGFLRLARATLAHLAVTGGMAAGESIIQQVLGHGLAARLSARLGEGVVNGLLTARIGIAAAEVCRPLPYHEGTPPRLADVMAVLRPLGREATRDSD